jgi:hypothetical protein
MWADHGLDQVEEERIHEKDLVSEGEHAGHSKGSGVFCILELLVLRQRSSKNIPLGSLRMTLAYQGESLSLPVAIPFL